MHDADQSRRLELLLVPRAGGAAQAQEAPAAAATAAGGHAQRHDGDDHDAADAAVDDRIDAPDRVVVAVARRRQVEAAAVARRHKGRSVVVDKVTNAAGEGSIDRCRCEKVLYIYISYYTARSSPATCDHRRYRHRSQFIDARWSRWRRRRQRQRARAHDDSGRFPTSAIFRRHDDVAIVTIAIVPVVDSFVINSSFAS